MDEIFNLLRKSYLHTHSSFRFIRSVITILNTGYYREEVEKLHLSYHLTISVFKYFVNSFSFLFIFHLFLFLDFKDEMVDQYFNSEIFNRFL